MSVQIRLRTLSGYLPVQATAHRAPRYTCVASFHSHTTVASEEKKGDGLSRGGYHEVQSPSGREQRQPAPKLPQFGSQFFKPSPRAIRDPSKPREQVASIAPATVPLDQLIAAASLSEAGRGDAARFTDVSRTKLPWPKGVQDQHTLLKEQVVMVREPALTILEALKANKDAKVKMPTFVVYGDRGTGKSSTVSHVANVCQEKGWLVLHVPDALQHTDRSKRLEPSSWRPGRIDQWHDASTLLHLFKQANGKLLSTVTLQHSYTFDDTKVSAGKPLLDLVNVGAGPFDLESLSKAPPSCDVLGAVCKELRLVTSVPVLVAVDGFNAYYNATSLNGFDGKRLHGLQLSLARFFSKFTLPEHMLQNGALVLGLTETGIQTNQKLGPEVKALLKQSTRLDSSKAFDGEVKPLMRVRASTFSPKELRHFLSYYREKGLLSRDVDDKVVAEVASMTDYIPEQAARMCAIA